MIGDSVRFLASKDREVIYDAEHFFDGYFDNPEYALKTLEAARDAGAKFLVLCDTNGGRLVEEVSEATLAVRERFPDTQVGIHAHNDSGLGVAISLASIRAGATMVQGTTNGYGERVGNANLTTILPNLILKMGYKAACSENLCGLRDLSLFTDELANLRPDPRAPFVGQSAFTHKGGTHADATKKVTHSYQHVDPALVGNEQRVLISDMAGRSSLLLKAKQLGLELDRSADSTREVIEKVKNLEFRGFEFEAADGSLQLLMAKTLGQHHDHFEFDGYRVIVERRGIDGSITSEATVKLRVKGEPVHTVAECSGPVGALDKALRLAIEKIYPEIADVRLRDYKVRILESNQGANAQTRVLIESGDGKRIWGTVGVSDNIIDASWQAIRDSVEFKLLEKPIREKQAEPVQQTKESR
jgi:2-isopropylmalate synthase